ncbi:MAG TPA: tetratricopeptide repeat protein, partial [Nitrospirae bacterium]|nr:tetratricopeptide repeat protein [Nitrospirota bacterium]
MNKIYSIIVISFSLLFLSSAVLASSAAKEVKEGNHLYKQKKYDDALGKYSSAKTELPDSDIINFNIGAAMYKKGDFQNAVEAFTRALVTEDKELEARANYNIANSKYSLANLKINTDPSGAASLYREALDYYKRAIELNQDDTEAKYNHELVEKKLKVLLDRLKNQPEKEKK